MLLTYGRLDVTEVQGTTEADVLVGVDADFRLVDGDLVIYEEPSFPVVELAWSLLRWENEQDRGEFVFDSMSFEELGAVTVRRAGEGWAFGSVFAPGVVSRTVSWREVERCVLEFVRKVRDDLAASGVDAAGVLGEPQGY